MDLIRRFVTASPKEKHLERRSAKLRPSPLEIPLQKFALVAANPSRPTSWAPQGEVGYCFTSS
jgi:hypothetical protein